MMDQMKSSLRPEAPRRRSRLSICLAPGLLSLALVVGTGCGPQASTSNPSGSQGTATGSIAFAVRFEPASGRSPLANTPAVAAADLDCKGLGIEWMRFLVLNEKGEQLKQKDVRCSNGTTTISGVTVGMRHLEIRGIPDKAAHGPALYTGRSGNVMVSTVEDANAGVVTVERIQLHDTEPFRLRIENPTPNVGDEIKAEMLFFDKDGLVVPGSSLAVEDVRFNPSNTKVTVVNKKLFAQVPGTTTVSASFGGVGFNVSSKSENVVVQDAQSDGFNFTLTVAPDNQSASPGVRAQYVVTAELKSGDPRDLILSGNCSSIGLGECQFSKSIIRPLSGEVAQSTLSVTPQVGDPGGIKRLNITATTPQTARVATANITVVVSGPLIIRTSSIPFAQVGQPYSLVLQATGGVPPYTWSTRLGRPDPAPGLFLGMDGLISGVPFIAGDFFEEYLVQDNAGGVAEQGLLLSVTFGFP